MPGRGTYQFDRQNNGNIVDSQENVERARKLFRDGGIISQKWGPGRDPSDITYGGWHSLCHLAAGAGVYGLDNKYLWVAITHAGSEDKYFTTVSSQEANGSVKAVNLGSDQGRTIIGRANLLGFVEGTSRGHILARNVQDPPQAFNRWPRQNYDCDAGCNTNGGTVWEHWSTTRDLRSSHPIGDSVLKAYVTLVSMLGGKFVACVARGRRSYNHPTQLCALVKAGFIAKEEVLWDTTPYEIPSDAERLLQEAKPTDSLTAVAALAWNTSAEQRYYMFKRKIGSWSTKANVEEDLRQFGL